MSDADASRREAIYTHGHDDAVLRSHRWRTAANSAAYLLPVLRPGQRLLDVGCGPGTLTADLARRVAPGETLGMDVEASVIAEASALADAQGNLRFQAGDLFTLDAGRFDVVHAHQVLQHLADPVGALVAMGRLLSDAPGAVVAVRDGDYSAMTWWPEDPALDRWLAIYRAVTRRNDAECDAGRRLLHWAHRAGFAEVTYTTSTWTFTTAADLAWWSGTWAQRITGTRLAEQAVAYGVASAGELVEVADGWRQWGQREDAVFIVPHGEVLARRPAR